MLDIFNEVTVSIINITICILIVIFHFLFMLGYLLYIKVIKVYSKIIFLSTNFCTFFEVILIKNIELYINQFYLQDIQKKHSYIYIFKKTFLIKKKIASIGNKYKHDVAKNTLKFASAVWDRYIDNGFKSEFLSRTSPCSITFQYSVNINTINMAIADFTFGKTIYLNT